jgi:hypothetical protein
MLAPGRGPLAGLIELVYRDKAAPQIALMRSAHLRNPYRSARDIRG